MRNLKRVLSLALATAMLFGMMVIGASAADKTAADLTDISKVTNKDAVNLMVDLDGGSVNTAKTGIAAGASVINIPVVVTITGAGLATRTLTFTVAVVVA